jgi:hypothetical protein
LFISQKYDPFSLGPFEKLGDLYMSQPEKRFGIVKAILKDAHGRPKRKIFLTTTICLSILPKLLSNSAHPTERDCHALEPEGIPSYLSLPDY